MLNKIVFIVIVIDCVLLAVFCNISVIALPIVMHVILASRQTNFITYSIMSTNQCERNLGFPKFSVVGDIKFMLKLAIMLNKS